MQMAGSSAEPVFRPRVPHKKPRKADRPGWKTVESACKPGSVRLAARQSFLSARRRRLAPATYPGTTRAALSFPYLVLLRVGFTVPYGVGPVRGALLPHPFTLTCALAGHRRSALCCTGRQLTLPRSYLALCPAEPGLSSMRSSRDATVRPTPWRSVARSANNISLSPRGEGAQGSRASSTGKPQKRRG